MMSQKSDIKEIMEQIVQFTQDRDWDRFITEKIWLWLYPLKLQS